MCSFMNLGEECKARVILNDKNVHPIDEDHIHPVQNDETKSEVDLRNETDKFLLFKKDIKKRLENALFKRQANKFT